VNPPRAEALGGQFHGVLWRPAIVLGQ